MAKRTQSSPRSDPAQVTHRYVMWAVGVGVWLLLAAALASFDPADPPAHAYGLTNEPARNWVGSFGALVAYKIHLVAGPGAWVALAGIAAFLGATALGRTVNQLALRATGLAIMTVSTSAMAAVGLPAIVGRFDAAPEGPGGLLAQYINDQLTARFNVPGTMVILAVAFWVGAILAADQWVMAIPRAVGRIVLRTTGLRIFCSLCLAPLFRAGRSVGRLLIGRRGAEAAAVVPPVTSVPVAAGRARRGRSIDGELIDEDAGGFGATEPFDCKGQPLGLEADTVAIDDPTDPDDDATDAPPTYAAGKKNFDPEQLRAKIKKLPINFAMPREPAKADPPREVDLSGYEFPSLTLLDEPESNFTEEMEQIVRTQALSLEKALRQYRIQGEVVGIDSGPVITLFEVGLAPGTKVAAISAVASDLARALKAQNIRIVPNMAGKDTVGIEVPNLKKERVALRELMIAMPEVASKMKLPMFLGKDASGNPLVQDLSACPHMLIAGTTGSGKSVCMSAIIMSFLYTRRPDELKLVLVDPKMVEMSMFKDMPHLMCPVVTEMAKATAILEWAVTKMDERYSLLAEAGVRDITGYNGLPWDQIIERIGPVSEQEKARIPRKLPYMVFIVDELADMMMTHKDIEGSIVRIAQKARAVGMHLILATQRPQANVVTGLIKSNMPARIAFKVASGMDSRIVLDQKGGELLMGQGDMLFLSPRSSKLRRAQGTLVDDMEIRRTVRFIKTKARQQFEPQLVKLRRAGGPDEPSDEQRDPLFEDAVQIVLESRRGSVSLLQRRLTIGYSRASRLIEQMAAAGIIGDYKGSQAREVTIGIEEWEAMKAQAEADARVAGSGVEVEDKAEEAAAEDGFDEEEDSEDAGDDEEMDKESEDEDDEDEEEDTDEPDADEAVRDKYAGEVRQ